jgi:hypothetical protein
MVRQASVNEESVRLFEHSLRVQSKQQDAPVTFEQVADVSRSRARDLRNQHSDIAKRVQADAAEDLEESREGLQRDGRFYASKYACSLENTYCSFNELNGLVANHPT